MAHEVLDDMPLDVLRRKRDQAWEMAGLANIDGDKADARKHVNKANEYANAIGRRLKQGETT